MLAFIFFAFTFSLYLGDVLGETYYGFLITGGIILIISFAVYKWGHAMLAERIKKQLLKSL